MSRSTLIGRATQMDTLDRLLGQVAEGRGQVALVAGEAGIGKSRLVAEVQTTASQRGFMTLAGYCFEPDRVMPYAPWLDMLRSRWVGYSVDEVLADLGPALDLATLFPELTHQLVDTPAPEPASHQRRLAHAFVQFCAHLAKRQPLCMVVEDLHWGDESSLVTLLALARHVPDLPVLLLLTYRSDEVHPDLDQFLAVLERERRATTLRLPRLSAADVATLVRTITHQPASAASGFLEALYGVTEGNPFFVEEMVKSLLAADGSDVSTTAWHDQPLRELRLPRSVQMAVQRRLAWLSPDARQALTMAAVMGRRFDFRLLSMLTGQAEGALIGLIKEMLAAHLVVEESADIFAFRHALTRQAVESDLLARERRALHRAIAEATERVYADALDSHTADLAEHYWAAEVWSNALTYSWRAGEQAQALYAPRAAYEQYTRALEAARRLGRPMPPELARSRGQMAELLGDFDTAQGDYVQALEAARATQSERDACLSLLALGWLWTGRDYQRAGGYFQQAITQARALGDSATLAQTLNRVGNWYTHAEQPAEGLRLHQEALGLFQTVGDQPHQAATLDLLAITSCMNGDLLAGVAYYEAAIALLRLLGDSQGLAATLAPYSTRGASYMFDTLVQPAVDVANSLAPGEEALTLARQMNWRSGEAQALMYLGLGLGPRGVYKRALEAVYAGLAVAEEIEHHVWMSASNFVLAKLLSDLFALSRARRHAEQALTQAQQTGSVFLISAATSFLVGVCIAQGDLARANTSLHAALRHNPSLQTLSQRLLWCSRAELALAEGQPQFALQVVEQLIASAAHLADGIVIPHLWRLRGAAYVALGQVASAETALLAALAAAQAQAVPPLQWRIHADLGQLYHAHKRSVEAEQSFVAAQVIIDALAAGITDPILRESLMAGASTIWSRRRPPTPRQAAKHAFAGLTEREREIVVLIAQGQTNRAIADTLVLSERTVAKHVENILAKLHLTSRAQVAVWAVEKRLMTPST